MFAGQNSFDPGMGEEAYTTNDAARQTFYTASEVFGVDMAEVCFGSRTEELPKYAQQSVVTAEIAEYHRLRSLGFDPSLLMPHSMGDFACLAVAKVTSERTVFELIGVRAKATSRVNRRRPGNMAAIMGLDDEQVALILHRVNRKLSNLKEPAVAYLANRNWDLEKVLSGHPQAIERAGRVVNMLKSLEIVRRCRYDVLTKIPGAFHSPLSEDAVGEMKEAFRSVELKDPEIAILGCNGLYLDDATVYPEYYSSQLVNGVEWQDMMELAWRDGIRGYREVGGQHTLEKFIKRGIPGCTTEVRPYGEIVIAPTPEIPLQTG